MSLTYFVIDNPDGYFHVVYKIPGTENFASVSTSVCEDAAERFAAELNGISGNASPTIEG